MTTLNQTALANEYLNMVGYDPFTDDASITPEEVAETLDGVWDLAIEAAAQLGDEAEVERLMIASGNAFTARWN